MNNYSAERNRLSMCQRECTSNINLSHPGSTPVVY